MADVVDPQTRSRMMSGIRAKNTSPELLIRKELYAHGFRYRLHDKTLPGNPDIILKKYQAVIFIHGCFWHRHQCHLFKWPKTRQDFWHKKLNGNYKSDQLNMKRLRSENWRVCIIWECAIREAKKDLSGLVETVIDWLASDKSIMEIST